MSASEEENDSASSSEEVFEDAIDPQMLSQKSINQSRMNTLRKTDHSWQSNNLGSKLLDGASTKTPYDNFDGSDSDTQTTSKPIKVPWETQKKYEGFTKTMEFLNNEFRDDLATHLYALYVLHTQNPFYPDYRLGGWPLPPGEVPVPEGDHIGRPPKSRYTSFALLENKSGMKPPSSHMLEKFRYHADPSKALFQAMDAIYERKVVQKIRKYNAEMGNTKGKRLVFKPTLELPIKLSDELRTHFTDKLDNIIDKLLLRQNMRAKALNNTRLFGPEFNPNLDWHDVSLTLNKMSERDNLRKLFSVYMDRDLYRSKNTSGYVYGHLKKFEKSLALLHNVVDTLEVIHSEVKGKKRKLDAFDDYIDQVVNDDVPIWTTKDRIDAESETKKKNEAKKS